MKVMKKNHIIASPSISSSDRASCLSAVGLVSFLRGVIFHSNLVVVKNMNVWIIFICLAHCCLSNPLGLERIGCSQNNDPTAFPRGWAKTTAAAPESPLFLVGAFSAAEISSLSGALAAGGGTPLSSSLALSPAHLIWSNLIKPSPDFWLLVCHFSVFWLRKIEVFTSRFLVWGTPASSFNCQITCSLISPLCKLGHLIGLV